MSGSQPCAPGWASGAWPALALALLTGLLWLWCRPLLPIDETRYLSVAWEMWLRGDFIVPYKNGAVYVDKPPLLFWLMQAGWALLGVNEWWPRLAPTLAAMAGLLLTARLAAHLWPQQPKAARLAPWLLASALLWQVFTGAVMFDTLLSVFSLLCLNALVAPPLGRGRWAWFALGIGGGLLTKGPVILLHTLPAALLAPWWWAGRNETGQWRRWYGGLLLGLLGGAAILAAWLWPAIGRAGASYGAAIGIHQTSDRLVHSYSHRRPWWWYLQLLPALPLPWTLWPPLYRGLARLRGTGDAGVRFCLTATLPALLIFCLISGKQAHYLLPLLAPAAVLAARALADLETPTTRRSGLPLALLLAVCGLAVLVLPHLQGSRPTQEWMGHVPSYVPVALLLAAALIGWPQRSDPITASYRTGLVFALGFGIFYAGAMQALAPRYRLTAFAERIAAAQAHGAPVAHVGKYHAQFQFLGRLRQPLTILHDEQLPAWAAAHRDGYVVYPCERWQAAPPGVHAQPYRGGALRLWPVRLLASDLSEEHLCGD